MQIARIIAVIWLLVGVAIFALGALLIIESLRTTADFMTFGITALVAGALLIAAIGLFLYFIGGRPEPKP